MKKWGFLFSVAIVCSTLFSATAMAEGLLNEADVQVDTIITEDVPVLEETSGGQIGYETIPSNEVTEEALPAQEQAEVVLQKQSGVKFHAELTEKVKKSTKFVFELYADGGSKSLGKKIVKVYPYDNSFEVKFAVPEYEIGAKFILRITSDNAKINFNGKTSSKAVMETYLYNDYTGKTVYQTSFYGSVTPEEEKSVTILLNGNETYTDYSVYGNLVYVSEDFIRNLDIDVARNENGWSLRSYTDGYSMDFFVNSTYAWKNGAGYNLKYPVMTLGGIGMLPLKEIADYFGCNYEETVYEDKIEINLNHSTYRINDSKEDFVNNSGVSSNTDYLIWISKANYTVNVFIGSRGSWKLYKSYPCALGAPSSPTIEGQFEYIERLNRWTYPYYYCGPVMRFYRGYALHSTLIRYDGTPYDDRVGVNISLGCIRLHPADIEELVSIIPFKTRIFITAE